MLERGKNGLDIGGGESFDLFGGHERLPAESP